MKKLVDFHMHTQASDGTWLPTELIEEIKKASISIFSVTDHDSIKNVKQVRELAKVNNLTCISGVELSATYNEREYHILAYNFDLNNPKIIERVHKNHQLRYAHHISCIETLTKDYPVISVDEFIEYEYDLTRGGWPALNYLIDKQVVKNMNHYFTLMEKYNLKLVFNEPVQVIKDIKEAGAIAVLAHPPAYTAHGGFMDFEQLNMWKDFGIQGIECYSPYYKNPTDCNYYIKYCNDNGLYISGGSDCHGHLLSSRRLGYPSIEKSQLNLPFLD